LTVHHLPSPKPVAALPGVRDASAQSASQLCAHVDKEAPSAVASSGFACGRNQRWRAARRAVQEEAGQVEGSLRERGMPRFDCAQVGFVGRCSNALQRACDQLNFYRKNGPSLSDTAQACLDIKYGFAAPPPPPALSKNPRLRQGVPGPPPPSPPPPSPPPLSLPPPPSPPPP